VKTRREERAREEKRRKWKCVLQFRWRRDRVCVWGGGERRGKNMNGEGVCREPHMRDKVFFKCKILKMPFHLSDF
jgi:hypothetical protein